MPRLPLATLAVLAATTATAEPRILAYGDSNTWGWTPVETGFPTERYPLDLAWPGILAQTLAEAGTPAMVEVDALSGRTIATAYPEPQFGLDGAAFSGLQDIAAAVASEMPLDLVVVMLGTNDARSDLAVGPEAAGREITELVARIQGIAGGVGTDYPAPRVLVVAPPAIGDTSRTPIDGVMDGAQARSEAIADAIVAAGAAEGFVVLDAREVVTVGGIDGVHLTPENHEALGRAIAEAVGLLLTTR